jgi:tonB-dependent receptor protein
VGYMPLTIDNKHKAINNGVFLEDLISLDDKYRLLLGGRFDFYEFKTRDINGKTNSYKGDSFSPRVGLLWDFLPEHTAYASYSKSFAPYGGRGNIGISADDTAKLDLKPQNNEQYEIGLKSTWADNKFSSNLAIFQIEHNNIKYQPDSKNNPYVWAERGKERSRGIELNILGQIYENLYLRSSLGYMRAIIVSDKSNQLNEKLSLNNTTNWQGNVFLRYAKNDKWYVESGVTGYSKRYSYQVNKTSITDQHLPGFVRLDASAGYNFNEHAHITLAINNILNKKYWRSDSRPGDERSFMINMHYTF